jgi:hypothetical protein
MTDTSTLETATDDTTTAVARRAMALRLAVQVESLTPSPHYQYDGVMRTLMVEQRAASFLSYIETGVFIDPRQEASGD